MVIEDGFLGWGLGLGIEAYMDDFFGMVFLCWA